jgi:aspartate/methionine/tyrosine aminotransferase
VAEKLRRDNGIVCDYESDALITAGSSSGIFFAMLALLDPGYEVLVSEPALFHYTTLIELCGGKAIGIPLDPGGNQSLDADDAENRITRRTKMLILNSPNNPTGTVLSRENIQALGELAEKYDLTVISDEIYEKIIYHGNTHVSPASMTPFKGRTVTSNGFSKAYAMTGWRVGYMAGPPEIIEKIVALNGYVLVCPSSVSQKAAYAALTDPRMNKAIEQMVNTFSSRRKLVLEALSGVSGIKAFPPQGTFYTWVDVTGTGMSGEEFSSQLLKRERIGVLPGKLFGEHGKEFVRISFAVSEDNLKVGLERFRRFASRPKD